MREQYSKPKILILADKRGGAFDNIAQSLTNHLLDTFTITIHYIHEKPDLSTVAFDLLYVMFWGERYHERFSVPPEKVIKEVASHRWELEAMYGKLTPEEFAETYLSSCNCVTTPSRRLYDMLSSYVTSLYHCPNGIETDLFSMRRKRSGPISIGWVGNPNDNCKGLFDILIPACKGRFQFRYSDGTWNRKRTAAFYNTIDVIAIASEAEGQPLPLMEGMASGCFPITTDVGIVSELIISGFNGLVIDRNINSFRNAFTWCENNLARIRRAGKFNSRTIAETRSWNLHIGKFKMVFETVLGMREKKIEKLNNKRDNFSVVLKHKVVSADTGNAQQDYADHLKRVNPDATHETAYKASILYYEKELKPLLPRNRESRIVDIGMGYGHLLRYLLDNGYLYVGGIDSSPQLVKLVREYLHGGPDFIELVQAFEFLMNNKEMFDVITIYDVIEHIPLDEIEQTVCAIHNALKQGGRVIIRTPNMANILGTYSRYMDITHVHGFTEFSLQQLLQNAGFRKPVLHIPQLFGNERQIASKKFSRIIHRILFRWQDRVVPRCFDKNLLMYAEK